MVYDCQAVDNQAIKFCILPTRHVCSIHRKHPNSNRSECHMWCVHQRSIDDLFTYTSRVCKDMAVNMPHNKQRCCVSESNSLLHRKVHNDAHTQEFVYSRASILTSRCCKVRMQISIAPIEQRSPNESCNPSSSLTESPVCGSDREDTTT